LKKVKKNWSHELKHSTSHHYENVKHHGKRRTKNHCHSRPETHLLHYWELGRRHFSANWTLYSNHVMWGGTV